MVRNNIVQQGHLVFMSARSLTSSICLDWTIEKYIFVAPCKMTSNLG